MKNLEIVVIGASGTGKTNVSEFIRRVLEEKGAKVYVQDSFDDATDVRQLTRLALDERLNDICPRLDIKVTAQHKRVIPNGR